MADILNRLLLETKDFDAKLSNSKRGVNSFQSDILGAAKTAGAGILKFAGGVGIAMGAVDSFTKVMGSQQSTQDAWDNNVFAAKLTVDKFFTSINNGDWTSFQNGFIASLAAAKNLSAEIDTLNDKRLSLTYIKSESLAKIEGFRAVATDTTEPLSVRRKAFADMQKERESLEKKTNETIKKETDVLIKTLNVKYGELNWNEDDVINFVVDTNFTGGSAEFLAYKEQLSELQSKEKKTIYNGGGVMGGTNSTFTDKAAVEKTQQFKLQNQHLEKQRILEQEIDATRKQTVNLLSQQARERRELSMLAKSENRIEKQLNKGGKTTTEETPLRGSIAAIDAELAAKNKELINATTMQARIAVQTTINELEAKKISLQIEVDKGVFKAEHGDNKLGNSLLSEMAGVINPDTGKTKGAKGFDFKNVKIKSPVNKKDVDLLDKYQEGLCGISDTMYLMSGVMNEGAASWLNWGASLLSSIAQGIPAIKDLILALQAKAAGEAIAGSAAAGPLGWITAGAALASIIATFASIPAFANGGIYQNGSTFGDLNLARVNAGEMILNPMQQGNLFRLLNSGSDVSTGNSRVVFKIHGRDLEGVLSNYTNQKIKVR